MDKPSEAPEISIIVPTINEAENLPTLLARIASVLPGRRFDVLLVDDNSRDRTPEVCAELARTYPLKLMVRLKPANGLSGAVLHGMAQARGDILCVMDADLQHPPEKLPELIAPLLNGTADFVIGSRYVAGGSTATKWGLLRKINSTVATLLARPFAGRVTDPMSGFFALRRQTYLGARDLTPLGYKIALELMCKTRVSRPVEIPIHFSIRSKGESKLSLKEQFRYLEHLSRLYDFKFPRTSPVVKFLIATGLGWLAGYVVYLGLLNHGPLAAVFIGYIAALLVGAFFQARYVRTQREFLARATPWLDFAVISTTEWMAATATAFWAQQRLLVPKNGEIFVLAFGAATLVRYVLRKEFLQDIRGLRRSPRDERQP